VEKHNYVEDKSEICHNLVGF